MAWTTPRTWVTGELVTAALGNTHWRDNLDYLKTEADKHNDVSHAEPARALTTIYQNASGKLRLVAVTVAFTASTAGQAVADIGSGTPPGTTILFITHDAGNPGADSGSMTFMVPANWYYRVRPVSTVALSEWSEWDLL